MSNYNFNQNEMMLKRSVMNAITDNYYSVYLVDIDNDTIFDMHVNTENINNPMESMHGAQELLNSLVRMTVVDKYKGIAFDFYDISEWSNSLQDVAFKSIEYKRSDIDWVRTTLKPVIKDSFNRVTHAVCITENINAQKKAELTLQKALEDTIKANRELLFNRSAIHQLGDDYLTIFFVDMGTDTYRLEKIEDTAYYKRLLKSMSNENSFSELVKAYIENFIVPEEQEKAFEMFDLTKLINELQDKKSITLRYNCIADKSAEPICIETHLVKINDGVSNGGMIVGIKNVEEEARAEREHRRALTEALGIAEKANNAKTNFLHNMSHDIRTPMNAIIGFTNLAKENLNDTEKVADYLNKISISSNHLLALINDVLEMGRIESGTINLVEDTFNIEEELNEIAMILKTDAANKDILIDVDIDEIQNKIVVTDKLRINQILLNIVGNSLKFTPNGGAVSLKVMQKPCARDGYGLYEMQVTDTGIGIKEEFIDHIFEPFSRENSTTVTRIQGTGLGMSITKRLVEMMGGTISVKSKHGKGTKFTVSLEFKLSEEPEILEKEEVKNKGDITLEGKRVLLVEDHELNREIAETILMRAGMLVETATDGDEAVDIMKNASPGYFDLILMDIQMPRMNGYEATQHIRNMDDPAIANIPIIAVTANAFDFDKENSFKAKMDAHIPKPIDIKLLLRELENILNR